MEVKMTFFGWVKEHKTAIIVTGVSTATIIGVVLIAKNWDLLKNVFIDEILNGKTVMKENAVVSTTTQISKLAENTVVNSVTRGKTIDVSKHLRNLSEGCHASADKAATAVEHGYILAHNQTWVVPYTKNCA